MYSLELEKEMSVEQIKESNTSIISNKLIEHVIPKVENTNIFLKVNKEKKSNIDNSRKRYVRIYP